MIEDVLVLPEALDDAAQAYAWYEDRSAGLGERFLESIETCIDRICKNPALFEVVYSDYRRAIVRHFPFVVFYEWIDKRIVIYSIFHSALDPEKWQRRLQQ